MNSPTLYSKIQSLALQDFDLFGTAKAEEPKSLNHYKDWIEAGMHGEMNYLRRHFDSKKNPQNLLPNAKSWIVLGYIYDTEEPLYSDLKDDLEKNQMGWVARYARGEDYHSVLGKKLRDLCAKLKADFPQESFWWAVDSKPVLERDIAHTAGLGWIGKNTCLINKDKGSFLFLAEILTTLDIPHHGEHAQDHCGKCDRCITSCPTGALIAPYKLDARLCLSYWTIESRAAIPENIQSQMGAQVFGCDICQDVCPWNKKARKQNNLRANTAVDFEGGFDLKVFCNQSLDQIKERIKNTALERAGAEKIKNQAEIVLSLNQNGAHKI